jgi:hypothetical protein
MPTAHTRIEEAETGAVLAQTANPARGTAPNLTVPDVVHPSAIDRQHLCSDPTRFR